MQLLCDDTAEEQLADPLSAVMVRDGSVHNTIPFNADPEEGGEDAVDPQYGRHEPYTYYRHCTARERNKGLFNADQNVNNNQGSTATRQQPNNNRYGYECPEERDYYPYWHPTPWRDVAVLTSDISRCEYYQARTRCRSLSNIHGTHVTTSASQNSLTSETCLLLFLLQQVFTLRAALFT